MDRIAFRSLCALVIVMTSEMLAGCTLVYIKGSGNELSDSGNHSGTLSVPESDGKRPVRLARPDVR
jgi:hypothetical protein